MNECFRHRPMRLFPIDRLPSAAPPQHSVDSVHRTGAWRGWLIGCALASSALAACDARSTDRSRETALTPPDSVLRARLAARQPALDSLVLTFRKRAQLSPVTQTDSVVPEIRDGRIVTPNRNARLHDLLVQVQALAVFGDARYPHCVFVRLESAGTRQAGLVNVGEGCAIPTAKSDSLLLTAPGAGDWYVYHTR